LTCFEAVKCQAHGYGDLRQVEKMQIGNDISLFITTAQRNGTESAYREAGENVTSISLSSDYSQYVHAVRDGYVEADGVKLSISDEAQTALKDMYEQWSSLQEQMNEMWAGEHNLQVAQQQGDAMEEAAQNEAKALEVARRIAKGGRVPASDEKALMEYSDKLYQMAKQAALLAKQHKKYEKALFEDEEAPQEQQETEEGPDRAELVMEIPSDMVDAASDIAAIAEDIEASADL
jgi:hypothetical protein